MSYTEMPLNESLSEAETKAVKYYTSCLDVNQTIESLGAQPLIDLIHKFNSTTRWLASWDVDVDALDLQDTLEKMHALGMSSFFSFWVAADEKAPTKNIMKVNNTSHCKIRYCVYMPVYSWIFF